MLEEKPKTIMVVDDQEVVRKFVCGVLEDRGFKVLDAESGVKALDELQENQADVHLLIADVVMPEMSGPEFVDQAKALKPGIKVLYMSGYTKYAPGSYGQLEAIESFIWKPFTAEAIAEKVGQLLGSRSGDNPSNDAT